MAVALIRKLKQDSSGQAKSQVLPNKGEMEEKSAKRSGQDLGVIIIQM